MRRFQEINEQEENSDDEDSQSGVSQIQGCGSDERLSELDEEPRPKKLAKTQAKDKGESSSTACKLEFPTDCYIHTTRCKLHSDLLSWVVFRPQCSICFHCFLMPNVASNIIHLNVLGTPPKCISS